MHPHHWFPASWIRENTCKQWRPKAGRLCCFFYSAERPQSLWHLSWSRERNLCLQGSSSPDPTAYRNIFSPLGLHAFPSLWHRMTCSWEKDRQWCCQYYSQTHTLTQDYHCTCTHRHKKLLGLSLPSPEFIHIGGLHTQEVKMQCMAVIGFYCTESCFKCGI